MSYHDTGNQHENVYEAKFDVSCYAEEHVHHSRNLKGHVIAHCSFAQLFAELKLMDLASDNKQHQLLFGHIMNQQEREYAIKALGQMFSYMTNILAHQH